MEPASGTAAVGGARGRPPWTTVAVAMIGATTIVSATLLVVFGAPVLNEPGQVAAALGIAAIETAFAVIIARTAPGNVTSALIAALGPILVFTNAVRADAVALLAGAWMLLYLPLGLVLLVAPSGRAVSRRWSAAGWTLCGVVAAFGVTTTTQLVWPAASAVLLVPELALLAAFFVLLIACAAAPFARYRRSGEGDRVRLRWVLAAGLSLPLTLLLCWASYLTIGEADLVVIGLVVMLLAIPAGATAALGRPLLFDIDRATVSAVAGVVLAAAALMALTVGSGAVGLPLVDWPPIPAAAVTATVTLAAVLSFPFVRRAFDRLLYPERARAIAGLRRLSARVDAGAEPPENVQTVLRQALRDPGLVVAYRRLADRTLVDLDGGVVATAPAAVAVRTRGEEIGAIVPSAGRSQRPATAIARAAAPLVDAVRARAELALAAAEVEASRERLLRAGYEERRRLERDLHDGAQQRLVALGMQLRVLQRTAPPGNAVAATLDGAVAQLAIAVAELRQLAHGVRPSALDDGLAAALAELGRLSPHTIELDVRAGELADATATTAYYVVSEAVANALRHAEASRIRVVVREGDGTLLVRVSDDGRGGAIPKAAGGLTGLSDRVQTLGGRLDIRSVPGTGTTVEARMPCGS